MHWAEASQVCRKVPNANLVSIHDVNEYQFLYHLAEFNDTSKTYHDTSNVWIGLYRQYMVYYLQYYYCTQYYTVRHSMCLLQNFLLNIFYRIARVHSYGLMVAS